MSKTLLLASLWSAACTASPAATPAPEAAALAAPAEVPADPCHGLPLATGFDFPVGRPDAAAYFDAQPFGRNTHLGSDWNGAEGGNSDFGDPVFAIADGRVSAVDDVGGGWGVVLRVVHRTEQGFAAFEACLRCFQYR